MPVFFKYLPGFGENPDENQQQKNDWKAIKRSYAARIKNKIYSTSVSTMRKPPDNCAQ